MSKNQALAEGIMAIFKNNPNKLFNHKQIRSRLDFAAEAKEVQYALDRLLKQEKIGELDRGKYHYINQMSKVEGYLQVNANGGGFLIWNEDEEDIYIAPHDLNHAFNGDQVMVQLYARRKKSKRLEGEVIEILQRRKKQFVGIVETNKDFAFVIPDDRRMYVDIFLPKDNLLGAQNGEKVLCEITDWPEKAKNPFGKIVEVLGAPGKHETEMHAIIAEFGFAMKFPQHVLDDADRIPEEITSKEIAKRRDFRKVTTFTIDPADAKDFDDALSFVELENGNVEVGVHIADVSHYVRPGTALDDEAFERATSVYLVDRTIPMLPERLSNGLCSLRPQEEKLTFSATFELDADAQVKKKWFGKGIIYSDKRYAYEDAQELIESGKGAHGKILQHLNDLALKLKEGRFKQGAISFETEEVKFILDDAGKPIDLYTKVRKDAHKLIEEFMLLANRSVAEYACNLGEKHAKANKKETNPFPFVYRVHDNPNQEKVLEFNKFIKRWGYQMKLGDEKQLAGSFNKLLEEVEGKPEQNILQSMAIRTMAKALYTTKAEGHYGLAFDHYSHFTSPIRRYPDLMVHRLLQYYLENKPIPKDWKREKLEKDCKHTSEMEQKAAEAERASVKFKQAEYLAGFKGKVFDAVISGVTEWGIYTEIVENKCEGMVRLSSLKDDFYEFDEDQRAIIGKRYKKRYRIGDGVRVQVKKTDPVKRQIDLVLVNR